MKRDREPQIRASTQAQAPNDAKTGERPSSWLLLLRLSPFLLNIGGLVFLQWRYDLLQYLAPEQIGTTITNIRGWASGLGVWGPLLFIPAGSIALLLNLPPFLSVIVCVLLYGAWAGAVALLGVFLCGSTLIYLVARWLGRPLIQHFFPKSLQKVNSWIADQELTSIIIIRLVFYMNPLTNWLLCVSDIGYRNLMLGTLIGSAPVAMVQIWLIHVLIEMSRTGQTFDLTEFSRMLAHLMIPLAILLGLRIWWPRFMARRRQQVPAAKPAVQDAIVAMNPTAEAKNRHDIKGRI